MDLDIELRTWSQNLKTNGMEYSSLTAMGSLQCDRRSTPCPTLRPRPQVHIRLDRTTPRPTVSCPTCLNLASRLLSACRQSFPCTFRSPCGVLDRCVPRSSACAAVWGCGGAGQPGPGSVCASPAHPRGRRTPPFPQGLRPYIKDAQRLITHARATNSTRIKQV